MSVSLSMCNLLPFVAGTKWLGETILSKVFFSDKNNFSMYSDNAYCTICNYTDVVHCVCLSVVCV